MGDVVPLRPIPPVEAEIRRRLNYQDTPARPEEYLPEPDPLDGDTIGELLALAQGLDQSKSPGEMREFMRQIRDHVADWPK